MYIEYTTYFASGEQNADCPLGKSFVPDSKTVTPGINFKQLGFGVSCVCINMFLAEIYYTQFY